MKKEEKQNEQEVICITEFQCFTKAQADQYLRYTVAESNYEILEDFICNHELATMIQGYSELNGTLRFLVGDEWVSVIHNPE